jgi:hypothetical protein
MKTKHGFSYQVDRHWQPEDSVSNVVSQPVQTIDFCRSTISRLQRRTDQKVHIITPMALKLSGSPRYKSTGNRGREIQAAQTTP